MMDLLYSRKRIMFVFIFVCLVLFLGLVFLVVEFKETALSWRNPHATLNVEESTEKLDGSLAFVGIATALTLLFIVNAIFFVQLNRVLSDLEKFDVSFTERMNLARSDQTDEIRELVMTRGVLLDKLSENKKSLENLRLKLTKR